VSEPSEESLPPGWALAPLAAITSPRGVKADPRTTPEARFIGMEHVEAHSMRLLGTATCSSLRSTSNLFRATDVLYGRLRSYLNKVYQPDFDGLCSSEFIVLPESRAILGTFLKYRLNSADFVSFARSINAGDRPRVDFSQIGSFSIALPPRGEQSRIADALDELFSDLDAAAAALERARERLELYRASVLKAAVEGALTAEWRAENPNIEPASQLLDRIRAERRRRWEADQIARYRAKGTKLPPNWRTKYVEPPGPPAIRRVLPSRWCWASTAQLCTFITKGTTPPGPNAPTVAGEIPFIKVQHLTAKGAFFFDESPSFVSRLVHDRLLSRSQVRPGDVLMNIVGPPLGQVSIVPDMFEEWNINQAIAVFRAVDGVSNRFLAISLCSQPVLGQALKRAKTSAGQINLTLQVCRELAVPLPPAAEQQAIVESVDAQLSVIDHLEEDLEAKLAGARSLRQAILKHAFVGKLVPQDAQDEPASVLLERIAAERDLRAAEAAKRPVPARNTTRRPRPRPS
jgi:type I restriction enzyme S subunit